MEEDIPDEVIEDIRDASRRLVRELGFMAPTLAGTGLGPSAVHALIEIGAEGSLTARDLGDRLNLEKSSVSRMVAKLVAEGELTLGSSSGDRREKPLSLTSKGSRSLEQIDGFARDQVASALRRMAPERQASARAGMSAYAAALQARRFDRATVVGSRALVIETGYRPGLIGCSVEMHARTYSRSAGFGALFESKVAAGLADFVCRLDSPANGLWSVSVAGRMIAMVAVDGEDLGHGRAHLRWFIVDERRRGSGLGRQLLKKAIAFCDERGFAETHLWTFRGLDAARRLYEAEGFELVEEYPGKQWGAEVSEQRFVRLQSSL